MGNFASNLKREVSHTNLIDLEIPPPPLEGTRIFAALGQPSFVYVPTIGFQFRGVWEVADKNSFGNTFVGQHKHLTRGELPLGSGVQIAQNRGGGGGACGVSHICRPANFSLTVSMGNPEKIAISKSSQHVKRSKNLVSADTQSAAAGAHRCGVPSPGIVA